MQCFSEFIQEAELIDLPLVERKYTLYRVNGSAMSSLDRFLVYEEWLSSWNSMGLQRSVSDHCAVVLKEKELN